MCVRDAGARERLLLDAAEDALLVLVRELLVVLPEELLGRRRARAAPARRGRCRREAGDLEEGASRAALVEARLDQLLDALAGRGDRALTPGHGSPAALGLRGRHGARQRGRVLGGHQREARAVGIVASRARAARAVAQPVARGQAVDAGLPVAQLVAVAGAAELVGLVEARRACRRTGEGDRCRPWCGSGSTSRRASRGRAPSACETR